MQVAIIIACVLLFALSAFSKAAMDTRTFQTRDSAFKSYPVWFREWMQRRGTFPVIKIDDGWHSMQALCFLSLGLAYLLAGTLWPEYGLWTLLVFLLRAGVHGLVFEWLYPMT